MLGKNYNDMVLSKKGANYSRNFTASQKRCGIIAHINSQG